MEKIKMALLSDNALVFKSNPILEGHYPKSLTPREMDLLTVLFTTINKDADDIATVRINIKDLIKMYGLENSKSAYSDMAEVSKRLMTRVIQVYNEEEKRLRQYQWLSFADYHYGEGYADFSFNEQLRPYLLELQQYAKYKLRYFLELDSFYAKRIYELLSQYKNMRGRSDAWERTITLEELRKNLGIEKKQYLKYANFKMRVLSISVEQINLRTDLTTTFEEIKLGRSVHAIKFTTYEKADASTPIEAPDLQNEKNVSRLLSYGVEEETARRLVADHKADVVQYNLDRLEASLKSAKGATIGNPAGWLVSEIQAGRGEQLDLMGSVPNSATSARASKEAEARRREARKAELRDIVATVRTPYKAYRKSALEMALSLLSDDEKEQKKKDFVAYMKSEHSNHGTPTYALQKFREKDGDWFEPRILMYTVKFFQEKEGLNILSEAEFALKKGVNNFAELSDELKRLEKGD